MVGQRIASLRVVGSCTLRSVAFIALGEDAVVQGSVGISSFRLARANMILATAERARGVSLRRQRSDRLP